MSSFVSDYMTDFGIIEIMNLNFKNKDFDYISESTSNWWEHFNIAASSQNDGFFLVNVLKWTPDSRSVQKFETSGLQYMPVWLWHLSWCNNSFANFA